MSSLEMAFELQTLNLESKAEDLIVVAKTRQVHAPR
jgi:hypothetical protein